MWLMLNDAFLSIVDKASREGHLLVRARRPGDIERVFPGVKATESFGTDYRYRAEVPRLRISEVLVERVMQLDYRNFKDSTKDKPLHDAYMRVWGCMERLQPGGAYAERNPRQRAFADDWLRGDEPNYDPFFEVPEDRPWVRAPKRRGGRRMAR